MSSEEMLNAIRYRIWHMDTYSKDLHPMPKKINEDEWLDIHFSKDEQIDDKIELLREWLHLKRERQFRGQVIMVEKLWNGNKFKTITFDLRNFEAYVRFKTRAFTNGRLKQIIS